MASNFVYLRRAAWLLGLIPLWASAAHFPLEIIHPRAGLDIKNRFYKAYPGLLYEVRPAVIGGSYPYTFTLSTAPAGMSIQPSTGTISWASPIASTTPYPVSLVVTDREGAQATVSWSVTVTTSGFFFVDAINGSNNAARGGTGIGTMDRPWKDFQDMYGGPTNITNVVRANGPIAKEERSYQNGFLYFRAGTYTLSNVSIEDGSRVPFVLNYKPVVWLAYPGERPAFDFEKNTQYSFLFTALNNNIYLDGIEIKNITSWAIQLESNQPGMVFRKMKMHDIGPTEGNNNQSFIRVLAGGQGKYLTIQESEFYNLNKAAGIKLYQTDKFLLEDNYLHDFINCEGFALKQDITRGTVRHNWIYNVPTHSIGGNMNSTNWVTQNNEILFNHVWGSCRIEVNQNGNAGVTYYERNTFECPVNFLQPGPGPFYLTNNVIQAASPQITGYTANVIASGNLQATSGLTDSSGNLTAAYSDFVGSKGWQTVAEAAALRTAAPKNLSVH